MRIRREERRAVRHSKGYDMKIKQFISDMIGALAILGGSYAAFFIGHGMGF